jgi:hypothetical protein
MGERGKICLADFVYQETRMRTTGETAVCPTCGGSGVVERSGEDKPSIEVLKKVLEHEVSALLDRMGVPVVEMPCPS